jgi:hypothetical protein
MKVRLHQHYDIIGIAGEKRHGKDSVADFIPHPKRIVKFAEPVKEIARWVYGLTEAQVDGNEQDKETVIPEWGVSPRQIMQKIGTEMGREIHPDTWIRFLRKRIDDFLSWIKINPGDPPIIFVVSDVRYPNEAEAIRSWGGSIWRVLRPGLPSSGVDQHPSETSIKTIRPDLTIVNDGTLSQLKEKVEYLYNLHYIGEK